MLPSEADRFGELLEAVGFAPVEAPEALGGYVRWFERAGTQVHLMSTEGATAPALGHAAFAIDDFEATVNSLRAAGFEVEDARELWGEARAFVLAPSGHRLELMASPPPRSAISDSGSGPRAAP